MTVGRAVPVEGELAPSSLVEMAVQRLRSDILSGALAPGEHLVEEQLTRRFNISRAPVREALRLLAEQGLVDHLPRRGVRVTTMSERDFDELFGVRDALEQYAVELACSRPGDPPDTTDLTRVLGELAAAAGTGDEVEASRAHRAFHLGLVALAGNGQLLATYEPVIMKLQLYMAANLHREAEARSPADGVVRHRRLLDAVAGGDLARIRAELAHHGARSYFR